MSNKLNNNIILMTGASGLIGTKLQKKFAENNIVINLDIIKNKEDIKNAHFIECDLTSDESVKKALAEVKKRFGNRIKSVFHLAAFYDFSGKKNPLYKKLTINGTKRLLDNLSSFNVAQFVYSSTNLVMKPTKDLDRVITEEDPLEGEWEYPKSKLKAEKYLKEHHKEIPLVILRIAGVYDEKGHSPPICNQIKNIYEKSIQARFYPGNFKMGQAFIHIDDVVGMFDAVVKNQNQLSNQEIFFVSEPKNLSYEFLQKRISKLIFYRKIKTFPIFKFMAKLGAFFINLLNGNKSFIKPWMIDLSDMHYPLSMKRAEEKLSFKPRRSLKQVLPEIICFLKSDPIKFYVINKIQIPLKALKRPTYEKFVDMDCVPKPWTYNPSAWSQRISISILAGIATVIAAYMSLFQLGLINDVWDPVFGDQTKRVLDSNVSHKMTSWFRIPDALLGALAYLGDIIFAMSGSTRRWQYRPWLVIIFGIDVIPLGIVSIILVLMQAFVVGQWCFLCLVTAAISLILILLAYDEVYSCLKYLFRVYKKSKSIKLVWNTLWGKASDEAQQVAQEMVKE